MNVPTDGLTLQERIGGRGGTEVWTGRDRHGTPVVVKLHRDEARAGAEAAALTAVGGAPAPTLLGRTTVADRPALVLERIDGTPLDELLLPDGLDGVAGVGRLVAALARAVGVVHDTGWAHGDVTPANVLVEPGGAVRLIDFDAAHRIGTRGIRATPGYAAPELLTGRASTAAADVYALAVTCRALLDDLAPPPAAAELRGLLDAAAATDPDARPTVGTLVERAGAYVAPAVPLASGTLAADVARRAPVRAASRTFDLPWPAPAPPDPPRPPVVPAARWPVVVGPAALLTGAVGLVPLPTDLRWRALSIAAPPVVTLLAACAAAHSTGARSSSSRDSARATTCASSPATNGFCR